jgi:hypothetical protein
MQRPLLRREELAFVFEAGVGGPELGAEKEAAEGFGAAGVDVEGILGWAGEEGRLDCAGVVKVGSAGVELGKGGGKEGSEGEG